MLKNKGNVTALRGRGYRARLNKAEQDALGEIAARHGYESILDDGVTLKPAVVFTLAIISGEVATVLLGDEERAYAIDKLLTSGDEILESIGRQMEKAQAREAQNL